MPAMNVGSGILLDIRSRPNEGFQMQRSPTVLLHALDSVDIAARLSGVVGSVWVGGCGVRKGIGASKSEAKE